MATRGQGLFSLYIYIENFKNLLVRNHWTDFNIILQKCSFGDPLPRLFKPFGFVKKTWLPGGGAFFPYIENFKNLLVRTTGSVFWFCRNVPLVILYQDCSRVIWICQKAWLPGGVGGEQGLFSLYIEKCKNHLVPNHWTDFHIILQKCSFGDPLPRLSSRLDLSKNMAARGQGLFSLYMYLYRKLKIFLAETNGPISI